jgi:LysR family transcriptional activator of dmlA
VNETPLLEDLRLFCAVVRGPTFAAAARELGVSKALVSKRIGILEQTLRVQLLHRSTRRLRLTAQGELAYQHALRVIEEVAQLSEAIGNHRAEPKGLLRLCASSGFGRNHVAPALSALALRFPQLTIEFELLDRPVDVLGEGFALDIRVGSVNEPDLIARQIASNYRVLCAAPAYLAQAGTPQTFEDLQEHRCIVIRERDQDFGRWTLKGPLGLETVRVRGPLSSNNGEVVHRWALEGHGIILRSLWDVGPAIARGELVHVLPAYAQEAHVQAVYPTRLSQSARLRVCVEFLSAWFDSVQPISNPLLPRYLREDRTMPETMSKNVTAW